MGVTEFRVVRQPSGTVDTSLYDVRPLREAFQRAASGGTLSFADSDGTTEADYPYGQRCQVQSTTDGGSTWTTRLEGFVANATPNRRDGLPQVDVDLVAYDHLLRRRKVYKTYSSTTISSILKDLITTFTAVTWNASKVTVTNDATISREFKGDRVDEAIAYLASESGDEEWGVDDSLEFFFQEQDTTRAPAVSDADVIDHDLPTQGKRAINRFKLFYGPSGNRNAVVVEDRESQQDLKNKLGTGGGVEIADSDTLPEVTDEDRAEAIARQQLDGRSVIRTGTVTVPLGRFGTEAGDVINLTVSAAGITDSDFRVAQIEYNWQDGETVLTIAENRGEIDDLLVALSDSVDNVRAREADPSVTPTNFLDLQSGVTVSQSATVIEKTVNSGAFTFGLGDSASEFSLEPMDNLGQQYDGYSTIATESDTVTKASLNGFRDVWQGESSPGISHAGVGSSDAEAVRADNSLDSQITRFSLGVFDATDAAREIQFDAVVPPHDTAVMGATLREWGWFDALSGNDMYVRVTHADASHDATTMHVCRVVLTVDDDPDEQGVITDKGQERLRDLFIGETGHEPSDMVYGTGSTDPAESDTSLASKSHEDAIDSTADRSTGITDIVERVTDADADTTNFSEVGYENSSNELEARVTFEAYSSDVVVETHYRFKARNA